MAREEKIIMIEDAQLIFRNFKGEASQYNREGDRNFAVVLDPKQAESLLAEGWNVKLLKSRDEGEPDTPYLSVAVSFKNYPPRIVVITSGGRTPLWESAIETLDYADMLLCDFTIRGYDWEVQDKSGTKAYLKTMFVTLREDELERKYAIHVDEVV